MGWLPPIGYTVSMDRPENSTVAFLNSLRKRLSETQMSDLFKLIDEWSAQDHNLADKYDANKGLSSEDYGVGQESSKRRKAAEENMLHLVTKDDLEVIKGMKSYGMGMFGPSGTLSTEHIGQSLRSKDAMLSKYSDLMENAVASAQDPVAKRKEIREALGGIINAEQARKKHENESSVAFLTHNSLFAGLWGNTTPLVDKQNKFIKTLSDTPGFSHDLYKDYEENAQEANSEELAYELMSRLDNAQQYASVKENGLPAGSIAGVAPAPNIPVATPEQVAANKAKAEVGKSGIFGGAEQDKLPVFYVSKDSPIKQGDLVDIKVGDKQVRAIAMNESAAIQAGIHAQLSTGLAEQLGITAGSSTEVNYAKVDNVADVSRRIEIASALYNQQLQNAQIAAAASGSLTPGSTAPGTTTPGSTAPGTVSPAGTAPGLVTPPGTVAGTAPGTIPPVGSVPAAPPAPAPIDPNAIITDASSFNQLAYDLTDTLSNDFGKMHVRIKEMENIPGLAAELDVLKTAIAKANQQHGIDITRSGEETHFVSSPASWAVRDLEEAALKNDGKMTIAEARVVILATAEAVEKNTMSRDSDYVSQGGMLEAVAQARASGADLVTAAAGKGAKPQNLVMAGGAERAPGT